jgi:23S rRNA pseudouridine2605 synthase
VRTPAAVPLERALSKLALASRSEARALIRGGRVSVDGRVITDAMRLVVPERVRIAIDGRLRPAAGWRMLALNKPRGVVTTKRDPEGRPTIFDVLAAVPGASQLVPVGRLDLATTGLLLLTTDTRLADWLTDPANGIVRRYIGTVRGELSDEDAALLTRGIDVATRAGRPERLTARAVHVLKRSRRETHLAIELTEGRNREIRRMLAAMHHEVTRLKRTAFGGIELGDLPPGGTRPISAQELGQAFPGAPIRDRLPSRQAQAGLKACATDSFLIPRL